MNTALRGRLGEDSACTILASLGLILIERNFRTNRGEVDIIATDHDKLCFIEVKCWSKDLWHDLAISITARKRHKIRETSRVWMHGHREESRNLQPRYDLLLIDSISGCHEWLPGALNY